MAKKTCKLAYLRFGCGDHGSVHIAMYELKAHCLMTALDNTCGFYTRFQGKYSIKMKGHVFFFFKTCALLTLQL